MDADAAGSLERRRETPRPRGQGSGRFQEDVGHRPTAPPSLRHPPWHVCPDASRPVVRVFLSLVREAGEKAAARFLPPPRPPQPGAPTRSCSELALF